MAERDFWFRGRRIEAVLFDLDGTLLDTAADIALALERALGDEGQPAPDAATVRTMIGRGAPVLVERAASSLGLPLDAQARARVLDRFFHHYGWLQDEAQAAAVPYAGVCEGLAALHAAGMPVAVVTNKQHRFALALLARLGLAPYVTAVVGGDSCERRKPDPLPLQHACALLGVPTKAALMVGDSVNDVHAARAAGMPIVCVPYGYNEGRDPRTLECDGFVETVAALPALLRG
jgi:phosphoglycolate phosphatase